MTNLESMDFCGSLIVYMPFKGLFFNSPNDNFGIPVTLKENPGWLIRSISNGGKEVKLALAWGEIFHTCGASSHESLFRIELLTRRFFRFCALIQFLSSIKYTYMQFHGKEDLSFVIPFSWGWFSQSAESHQRCHLSKLFRKWTKKWGNGLVPTWFPK